ncbi:MAG: hypothetical protein KGJ43_03575 [Acidobacteriota bacterium]|nr:hypothetical protein [Acidobacteriota bacterium]
MQDGSSHIPYARVSAALEAGDLGFIVAHAEALSLGLAEAVEVCRLIATQTPARLDGAALRWIRRYAAEARAQRFADYGLIVESFAIFPETPAAAAGSLRTLCAARGLEG